SRRRHTRLVSDWSSDVCSSDLLRDTLPAEDQALLAELRSFLETKVAPDINTYWTRAEFPHHLVPELAKLGVIGTSYGGYGFRGQIGRASGRERVEVSGGSAVLR